MRITNAKAPHWDTMRVFKSIKSVLAALWVLFAVPALGAQDEEAEAFPEINEINVVFDGFQSVSGQYVLSNIQLREGMDYNPTLVDQSVRTLYNTGYFEFVEIKVETVEADRVDVVVELVPKYKIQEIRYSGNDAFSDSRLVSKAELETGVALDEYQISVAADKLEDYYLEKGFSDIAVDYSISRDAASGFATVVFEIDEGSKVKVTDIRFEGNEAFSDGRLRKVMETKQSNLLSWLTGDGKFSESTFDEDLDLLRQFYRDEGYLDIAVDEGAVALETPKEGRLEITIPLDEGQRYSLGQFSVENATIFTEGELLQAIDIETGEVFSPSAVDDAATAMREYYTSRGYLDSVVRAERVPNMETRRIDLNFRVRESEKFFVESIKIEGNTKTKSRVIIRELALRPGDVFDLNRMETSQARLENTAYFEDVRLNPESTNVPGRRDLGITVREARTGNFTFGAGFGSVESAVVYFEITQGNFDLFNWRSGFQGDGQKFRFRAALGTDSNEVVLTFEEPWLFEQRLAFGVELFRRESDFNSTEYNELRTGFELYLRRRLFELVEARLSYRLELVEIFDVAGTEPPFPPGGGVDNVADVFQEAEGEELVSKIGLTFLRDNRNSLLFTRRGNRTSVGSELAGLGGEVNYFKLEGRTAHFVPTFDLLEQSFSIVARAGSIAPYGQTDIVPFYDRFYLGGPDSLRGFDFRDIGPRDPDDRNESVGGNTYGLLSLEYLFRIAEPLGLVVFYDAGFVNEDEYDFSASDYADNWGVGARVLLMGSPLKLDLGIPITSPEGAGDGTQFNFSFGTRF